MEIVVVGTGAIGGALAGYLAAAGYDVTALDEWSEHVEAINRDGLRVSGARGTHRFELRAAAWNDVPSLALAPDLALICVKTYDTERAAHVVQGLLGASTVVVSTQNGLSEDLLAERFGQDRVVGAVTEIGGHFIGPGEIVETRADGGFVIGELDGIDRPRTQRVQEALSACAPTNITSTIRGVLWSKLVWNCMMNPLTALTGLGQGAIWTTADLAETAVRVGREAAAVAHADGSVLEPLTFLGVDLPALLHDDPDIASGALRDVVDLYRPQSAKSTSMREDVLHGRRTEIEALNGHVVKRGLELGVPVDLNVELVRLVRSVGAGELAPGPNVVDSLRNVRPVGRP